MSGATTAPATKKTAAPRVAQEGERVHVLVDTTRELENPCTLTLFVRPHGSFIATHHFSEVLDARAARAPKGAPPGTRRWVLDWTVKLTAPDSPPPEGGLHARSEVTFEVSDAKGVLVQPRGGGVAPDGQESAAAAPLTVSGVRVTGRPEATRLLRHEHNDEGGAFDPAPLRRALARLHPVQRSLLLNYPLKDGRPRLVAFVTLTPEDDQKRMNADYARMASKRLVPVRANAAFTLFRCAGPGDVELLVHTGYLLVNDLNGPTRRLMAQADGRAARRPRRWLLATGAMGHENYGVPFMRIFTPHDEGPEEERSLDAMCDATGNVNSIHGTINTVGCWSLFRNYNWPRRYDEAFERTYLGWRDRERKVSRDRNRSIALQELVAAMAPDEARPYTATIPSWRKFIQYDQNFAYFLLFHDLLGLQYNAYDLRVNDGDPTGRTCQGELDDPPPDEGGPPNAYSEKPALPVWAPTALGDGPFQFVSGARAKLGDRTVWRAANLAAASYADLFLYAEREEPFTRPEGGGA